MADLALTFSTSNLSEMFAEAQQQTVAACQSNVLESVYTLEKPFGRLTYRCIRLREGLELYKLSQNSFSWAVSTCLSLCPSGFYSRPFPYFCANRACP